MRKWGTILLCFSGIVAARFEVSAQVFDTEWTPQTEFFAPEPEFAPEIDPSVFVSPVWSADGPFEQIARYRLSGVVRYRQRGLDSRRFRVSLGGADLSDRLSYSTDYSLITLLRRSGLAVDRPHVVVGAAENYSLQPAGDRFWVSARAGDRYSRGGGDVRHFGSGARGWSYLLAATGEGGPDGHIKGVFTNALGGIATLSKEWASGARLTFFAAAVTSERGVRVAATQEAFSLTGNNLYNPVWGLQQGEVRNSRVNGVKQVFGAVEFSTPLGGGAGVSVQRATDRTLSLIATYRRMRNGRTRLAWFDTHSPLPDYYRSMPSFFPPGAAASIVEEAWQSGEESVTQVDWTSFYYNNTLAADGRATWFVEEQVEAAQDFQFSAAINRVVSSELELSYGLRARFEDSRFFKEAADLLGATWMPNEDQYAEDQTDGEYHSGPPNENDLRHPGRQVAEGERFGYDYDFTRLRPSVFGVLNWVRDTYGILAEASLTHTRLQREGFYEKELFPGEAGGGSIFSSGGVSNSASFGRSAVAVFTTFSASLSAYWSPGGGRHRLGLSTHASSEAPRAVDMFLSPEQNSLMVSDLTPSGLYGASVSWAWTGERAMVRATAFVNAQTSETQVRHYYDDLSGSFADMVLRGVDRLGMGVEFGAEVRLAAPLTLSVGASVGDFRYNSEPRATIFEDATGRVIADGVVCYQSGLRVGLPQRVAGVELEYYDRKYWRIALNGEWLGGRHVEINPLYHSSRVVGINPSPEIMAQFTDQQRLPDAVTLGVSVSKGWVLGRGYLRIAGSVRNILGASIIHSGYEQMRIRRRGSGAERVLVPFPTKYMWSYPATWNITISYRI